MTTWSEMLIDGKFHAVTAIDNIRFRAYFECGLIKQFTAPVTMSIRTTPVLIQPSAVPSEEQCRLDWFDMHCKSCMGVRKTWYWTESANKGGPPK